MTVGLVSKSLRCRNIDLLENSGWRDQYPLSTVTRPRVLNVQNRKVRLNKACGSVADCTFEELCDRVSLTRTESSSSCCCLGYIAHVARLLQPLGASDYLEMSRLFDTIFIRHIPQLTLNQKTQARRLITLVDALYDHKVHQAPVCKPLLGKKKQRRLPIYVISGAGSDSSRSSIGGYFRAGPGGSRTRWEPHSDGWSGAEEGQSSDMLTFGTNKWIKESSGNLFVILFFLQLCEFVCETGGSQQSVYLQRRRGKICLPEDGVPTHRDADRRILDRRRQKYQVAVVAFRDILFRSLINVCKKKKNLTPLCQHSTNESQTRGWGLHSSSQSCTENIYLNLKGLSCKIALFWSF